MVKEGYRGSFGLVIKELGEGFQYFNYIDMFGATFVDKVYFNKATTYCRLTQTTYKTHNDSYVIQLRRETRSGYGLVKKNHTFVYVDGNVYSHNDRFKRIPNEINKIIEDEILNKTKDYLQREGQLIE